MKSHGEVMATEIVARTANGQGRRDCSMDGQNRKARENSRESQGKENTTVKG